MTTDPPEQPTDPSVPPSSLDLTRAVILAIAFVVVLLIAMSGLTRADGSSTSSSAGAGGATTTVPTTTPATTTTAPQHHTTTTISTVPKNQIKVQVANGTSTAGVATQITSTLQAAGWNMLPPVNATSTASKSVVYYAANRKWAAEEIAAELKLPASSVTALTTSVPVPGAAGDDVVVLIGPDLATS